MWGFLKNLVAFGMVAFVTPAVAVAVLLASLIYLPLPATIPEPIPGLERNITHVYDAAGNEIATFKEFETSIRVEPADIPQVLKDAVIASEDRSYYSHGGFDLRGTVRALWTDLQAGEASQGGSTITQQYVRIAFEDVGTEDTVARKIREAIMASQVDRALDKEEILFRYLSTVYFGEGAYGIGAAAQTYFRKSPRDLTLSEAAVLVGTLPAPTLYSPRDHPAEAERRRLIVLGTMLETGVITADQHAVAAAETIWHAYSGPPPPGPATMIQAPVEQETSQPWFTDYLRSWIESSGVLPDCTAEACPILYRGGLRIETTLDPRAQLIAQDQVNQLLEGTPDNLEAAIVAVEPPTGFVRAIVGGRDFGLSQVNTALRPRQTGSTAKVFVLATAFEQGIQPSAVYSGASYTVGDYTVSNYGGSRYGNLDLRTATTSSVNAVFTRLIEDVTVESTFDLSSRLGVSMPAVNPDISTPNYRVDANDPSRGYGVSVALGAIEVSPLEMASAYGVFANHGLRATPTPVVRIFDVDGNVLVDNLDAQAEAARVVAPEVADNVTDVLTGVLTDGTAQGRALAGRPAAGKTGTAQENANAWFVGYTPTLSTAVWIGYRDCGAGPQCRLANIAGHRGAVTGGSLPARTWQRFMNGALEGVEVTEFTEPAPIPDVRDEVLREQRRGFAPGRRRAPSGAPSTGGYVEGESGISIEVPETTSTTGGPTTTRPPSTTIPDPDDPPITLFPP